MQYLVDTCVWIDFFEERISKTGRHLGSEAAEFINKALSRKDEFLIIDMIISELKNNCEYDFVDDFLKFLMRIDALKRVEVNKENYAEAKSLSSKRSLPFPDCLYAVIARDYGAVLVTQDRHLLEELKDVTATVRPEEVT